MASPLIRRAAPEDASVLADLAARTFQQAFESENTSADMAAYVAGAFSVSRVAEELGDPESTFLLALGDAASPPIGYAKLRRGAPDASVRGPNPIELERLYVARQALGSGIGSALLAAALEEARRLGCSTVWLGVWERNRRAIEFYQRWGFEVVGAHDFRLGSDRQNDLIMERPAGEEGSR